MTLSPESAVVLRDPSLCQLPVVSFGLLGGGEPESSPAEEPADISLSIEKLDELRAESFADGERIGRQAAHEQQQAENEALAGVLRAAIDEVAEAQARLRSDTAADATDLALRIAELILQREVCLAQDPGRDAIARCLGELRVDEVVTFHLNPADIASLNGIETLLGGLTFEVVADRDVVSGDCLVLLPGGSIDGSIAGAMSRLEELLR